MRGSLFFVPANGSRKGVTAMFQEECKLYERYMQQRKTLIEPKTLQDYYTCEVIRADNDKLLYELTATEPMARLSYFQPHYTQYQLFSQKPETSGILLEVTHMPNQKNKYVIRFRGANGRIDNPTVENILKEAF
jgi:hypothetical protein